jgi:hypothetical protein
MKRLRAAGNVLSGLALCLGISHGFAQDADASSIQQPLIAGCSPQSVNDWPAPTPYSRMPMPQDCAVISHDPPVLGWATQSGTPTFEVKLGVTGSTSTTTLTSNVPWLYWPNKLGPGNYSWWYRVKGATAWSLERRFQIGPNALDYTIPDMNVAWSKVVAMPHPRTLPQPTEFAAWQNDWFNGARKTGWAAMRSRVIRHTADVLPADPSSGTAAGSATAAIAAANKAFMNLMNNLSDQLREVALVAVVEPDPTTKAALLADAKRRTLYYASLNPVGATSYDAEPGSGRKLMWSLAQAYDWLYPYFTDAERATIRAAVTARVPAMLNPMLDPSQGIARKPLDSFSSESMPDTIIIAAAIAESSDAKNVTLNGVAMTTPESWYKQMYPVYFAWISAWGGDDGGFANGTNYLIWNIEVGEDWDMLRFVTGVDITHKSWTHNLGREMVYFQPPGSPNGIFGDGAELNNSEPNDRLFRPYAARTGEQLYSWYSGQLFGGDESRLMVLFAPPFTRGLPLPANTPNSIWLPSIGWTAMHSDLANRARTSIYFKSSVYGSYDHSHADQNSFIINANGRPLAIESGIYDYYGSAINIGWSKMTQAHNAITFDGGVGQSQASNGRGDISATGALPSFVPSANVDIANGVADTAYGTTGVNKSRRSIVYIRPSTILVFDTMGSTVAHKWEWNIHGVVTPASSDNSSFKITNIDTSLCGKVVSDSALTLSTFAPSPTLVGASPATQWHGRYSVPAATTAATFAAALSTDCTNAPPITPVRAADGSWTVTGPTWVVTYKNAVATYTPK